MSLCSWCGRESLSSYVHNNESIASMSFTLLMIIPLINISGCSRVICGHRCQDGKLQARSALNRIIPKFPPKNSNQDAQNRTWKKQSSRQRGISFSRLSKTISLALARQQTILQQLLGRNATNMPPLCLTRTESYAFPKSSTQREHKDSQNQTSAVDQALIETVGKA